MSHTKSQMRGLFGDQTPEQKMKQMIRVDHAGEYGAIRIYQGQLAVLRSQKKNCVAIEHMANQEKIHLETFNQLIKEYQVRPTLLQPLWHFAGYALGVGTALMGEKAAMACTVAIEEVIDEHYENQAKDLDPKYTKLTEIVNRFRIDEQNHRDQALASGAQEAPAYPLLSFAIKSVSKLAIMVSERL